MARKGRALDEILGSFRTPNRSASSGGSRITPKQWGDGEPSILPGGAVEMLGSVETMIDGIPCLIWSFRLPDGREGQILDTIATIDTLPECKARGSMLTDKVTAGPFSVSDKLVMFTCSTCARTSYNLADAAGRAGEHVSDLQDDPLDEETATYHAFKEEFLEHEGQWVLIKGPEIIGVYPTADDAEGEAIDRFDMEPVLIRQIRRVEPEPATLNILAR